MYLNNIENNERLVPTGKVLAERNFPIALWIHFQVVSELNSVDGYRYVRKDKTTLPWIRAASKNLKQNEYGFTLKSVSINTALKQFKYLKEQGYILEEYIGREELEKYHGKHYKIDNTNTFKSYTLMGKDFLNMLLHKLSNESLRVYFFYYSFTTKGEYKICDLSDSEILKGVGLSQCGKNRDKLRFINKQLIDLGLIRIENQTNYRYGIKMKEKSVIIIPLYWKVNLEEKL